MMNFALAVTIIGMLTLLVCWTIGLIAMVSVRKKREQLGMQQQAEIPMQRTEPAVTETAKPCKVKEKAPERFRGLIRKLLSNKTVRDKMRIAKKKRDMRKRDEQIRNLLELMKAHRNRMNGEQYEIYCAVRLASIGWGKIELTKASGDFGVDVLAYKDGAKYCVQCKCYSSPVGIQAVQEAYSGKGYYDCDKALVVTNNKFTSAAHELANKLGVTLMEDF